MSRKHPGSRLYARLNPRLWAAARRAALLRSGYRSELSGKAGRLEVHHRVHLENGGDPYGLDNLLVVTKLEHRELHRGKEIPGQRAWREFLDNLL